jgi:flagellar motor switch protein FliN/FliY
LQTDLDKVFVNLSVILGQTIMPVHKLLRMGRGAVIELTSQENDMVEIVADGHVFAHGQVIVSGSRIQVEITEMLRRPRVVREKGMANPPPAPEPEPEPLAA